MRRCCRAAPLRHTWLPLFRLIATALALPIAAGMRDAAAQYQPALPSTTPTQNVDPWMQFSTAADPAGSPAAFDPAPGELDKNDQWAPPPAASLPQCLGNYRGSDCTGDEWHSQVLPHGIIYQSYMAVRKNRGSPRTSTRTCATGNMWDVALGARAGIWRYGNDDPNWPEGWQVDMEGGVFPRLDPNGLSTPLIADDFRFGIPVTYGGDRWEFKVAYYHISSHLGDEYILEVNPAADRINFAARWRCLRGGIFFHAGVSPVCRSGLCRRRWRRQTAGIPIRLRLGPSLQYRLARRAVSGRQRQPARGSRLRR